MPLLGREKVDKMLDRSRKDLNDDLRGVFLSGLQNIISETPADKGRARNNWFGSVGSPSGKTTTMTSGNGIAKLPKDILAKKLFYTNNLPYITTLEYGGFPDPVKNGSWINGSYQKLSSGGYSKQLLSPANTPKGWVRSTLIKMQTKIRTL